SRPPTRRRAAPRPVRLSGAAPGRPRTTTRAAGRSSGVARAARAGPRARPSTSAGARAAGRRPRRSSSAGARRRPWRAPVLARPPHVLPGLDDGARSLAEARAIGLDAAGQGVSVLAATPHVRDDYPTTPEAMEDAVVELRDDFAEHGIPVEVLHGAEVALDLL